MCDLDLFVESPIVLLLSCGWPSHFVLMNCFEDRSPLTPNGAGCVLFWPPSQGNWRDIWLVKQLSWSHLSVQTLVNKVKYRSETVTGTIFAKTSVPIFLQTFLTCSVSRKTLDEFTHHWGNDFLSVYCCGFPMNSWPTSINSPQRNKKIWVFVKNKWWVNPPTMWI
jgi:hypothetical protein